MPKVLTEAQVSTYERDGCLSPVRAMSAERARHYREQFEALEARVPDIKKMKTKSHLLCPWVLEIAEDPHILDIFEDLIGPNIKLYTVRVIDGNASLLQGCASKTSMYYNVQNASELNGQPWLKAIG